MFFSFDNSLSDALVGKGWGKVKGSGRIESYSVKILSGGLRYIYSVLLKEIIVQIVR